jgi:prepilin-type N-terminal cleavage/methylation domain-containing protein
MRSKNKGFTLIEMLIVIAIIGILAGIVLTGVRGFQATARDTRRIGDVRNIQPLLELYFTRNGTYPGALTDLSGLGTVPTDPTSGSQYDYSVDGAGLSYCVGATLESTNSAAVNDAQAGECANLSCSNDDYFCVGSD